MIKTTSGVYGWLHYQGSRDAKFTMERSLGRLYKSVASSIM
jgi:hypothetical protein